MDRDKISEQYKWDLSNIYKDISEFRNDILLVKEKFGDFSKYENIVYDENTLYEVIDLYMEESRRLGKLSVYTSLLCDQDTSVNKNQELKEEISNLSSEFSRLTYFVEVNILKLDYNDIRNFYDKNEKLKEYDRYFSVMFRYKEHTLSDQEEKLLANLSKVFGNNYESYELLKDSDMSFPLFTVDGKDYELTDSKYSLYIESDNREIRKGAFNTLYETYKQYKNIFANLISSNIKEEVSISRIKKFNNSLEASLYSDELDVSIYDK